MNLKIVFKHKEESGILQGSKSWDKQLGKFLCPSRYEINPPSLKNQFHSVSSQREFDKKMHLHIGDRSLDELRCEEGYRGWIALKRLMPQIKDIKRCR